MSKKKKKKTGKSIKLLKELDKTLIVSHDSLIEEIEETQRRLAEADARALKKQKKKLRKEMGAIPYYVSRGRVRAREEAIRRMEETNLLERVEKSFKMMSPLVIIIARLIAVLIDAILMIEPIRRLISPETIKKMDNVHRLAMAIR
jgi:hypothetical protein